MRKNLLITLSGHDRIGIVEYLTKIVLASHGNVDASRMAHLGGEFAMLMLISVPVGNFEDLQQSLNRLQDEDFVVTTCETEPGDPTRYKGWIPYQIEVNGADHEGIIHTITQHLAKHNINVETMDTNMVKAPMSGTPLFTMNAIIVAPPDIPYHKWYENLEKIRDDLNVDIEVLPYKG
jgi:glycine cleavage system transcriptional repressor